MSGYQILKNVGANPILPLVILEPKNINQKKVQKFIIIDIGSNNCYIRMELLWRIISIMIFIIINWKKPNNTKQ
jgi:flagellar biosynthesis regulator FlaF